MKSTSSAYAISLGRVCSDSVSGYGSDGLTSLRTFSRYTTNRIVLRLSPWGVPILFVNFFSSFVPPILIFRQVLLRKNRNNLSSSSSMMVSSMLRRVALSIVPKAADMSISVIVMFIFSCSVFAASHLCVHATFAVLLFGRKPFWLFRKLQDISEPPSSLIIPQLQAKNLSYGFLNETCKCKYVTSL